MITTDAIPTNPTVYATGFYSRRLPRTLDALEEVESQLVAIQSQLGTLGRGPEAKAFEATLRFVFRVLRERHALLLMMVQFSGLTTSRPPRAKRMSAQEHADTKELDALEAQASKLMKQIAKVVPPASPQPAIARNAKCPCGSGEKYKQCCGKGSPPKLTV